MTLQSIIDPKKKKKVIDALKKGDVKGIRKEKKTPARPLVEQPTAGKKLTLEEQGNLNKELLLAVDMGYFEMVLDLIQKGVDVNARDEYGRTPLMLTSEIGHTEIAEFLIQKGADINARDADGWTSLMHASRNGNMQIAKLFIQHNADVNAKEIDGRTPLMIALEFEQFSTAELLKKHGAKM
jgi:ankyrin repeat protein